MDTGIIIVFGGREYGDKQNVFTTLDDLHSGWPLRLLIQGGADGADSLADLWAASRSVPRLTVPALWGKFGKGAGPIRNREMLKAEPDLAIGFPGGRGTSSMIAMCREQRVPLWLVQERKASQPCGRVVREFGGVRSEVQPERA
jgi:hypothetical protein